MFTIIICAVAGAAILGILIWRDEEDTIFALGMAFYGLVIGAIVGLLVSFLLMIPAGEPKVIHKGIIALKDNSNIHGSFFLGCGTIDEEMYYYYMADNGDGGYKMEKVEAENACIYEEDTNAPYITISYRQAKLAPWWCLDI